MTVERENAGGCRNAFSMLSRVLSSMVGLVGNATSRVFQVLMVSHEEAPEEASSARKSIIFFPFRGLFVFLLLNFLFQAGMFENSMSSSGRKPQCAWNTTAILKVSATARECTLYPSKSQQVLMFFFFFLTG